MNPISRLNTTISDHAVLTNFVGVCLVVFGSITLAVAVNQSGNLAESLRGTLQSPASTIQQPAIKTQTASEPLTLTVRTADTSRQTIRGQQPNIVAQLQPAQNTIQVTQVTTEYLQPAANSVQLTGMGTDLQDAHAVLQ